MNMKVVFILLKKVKKNVGIVVKKIIYHENKIKKYIIIQAKWKK